MRSTRIARRLTARLPAAFVMVSLLAVEGSAAEEERWPIEPVHKRPAVERAVEDYLAQLPQPGMFVFGRGLSAIAGGWSGEPPEFDRGSEDDETPEEAAERWSSFLPLLGKQARERGYDLPPPFGVGLAVGYLQRKGVVKSVKVALNENPFQEVQALGFRPNSEVFTLMTRFDAWILPFVNIYGLVGYTWNVTDTKVTFQTPGGAPGTLTTISTELEGPTYGGGVTVAGGVGDLFVTLDWNYVYVDLGGLDSSFSGSLISTRIGWNFKVRDAGVRVWTGATYWDTEREVEGSIPLPGGDVVRFRVLQGPKQPWTALLGLNVDVGKAVSVVLEFQFNEYDFMSVVSISYRF